MWRLKLAFFRSLVFILTIELIVLFFGIWWLIRGSDTLKIAGMLVCLAAMIPSVGNIYWLFRFLKGQIFHHSANSIVMDGGELVFAEPPSPYEVWLFCKIPFSRYRGQVSIQRADATSVCNVEVLRHSLLTRSLRSDCTPLVMRPQQMTHEPRQCCLKFHLRPASKDTPMGDIFPADETASITVMVKSA
jgi:hypothetical protein